jgi:hypothetical protein
MQVRLSRSPVVSMNMLHFIQEDHDGSESAQQRKLNSQQACRVSKNTFSSKGETHVVMVSALVFLTCMPVKQMLFLKKGIATIEQQRSDIRPPRSVETLQLASLPLNQAGPPRPTKR